MYYTQNLTAVDIYNYGSLFSFLLVEVIKNTRRGFKRENFVVEHKQTHTRRLTKYFHENRHCEKRNIKRRTPNKKSTTKEPKKKKKERKIKSSYKLSK